MSRVRINKNAIDIAKPGHNVETAGPENMVFSALAVAARVAYTGTVSVGAFSGYMSANYNRGIVTFPAGFPSPPIVLVAGAQSGGASEQGPLQISGATLFQGNAYVMPHYSIETFTDRFELFVLKSLPSGLAAGPSVSTWQYWVLANILES